MSTSQPTLAGLIDVQVRNLLDQDSGPGSETNLYISDEPQELELRLWNLLDRDLVSGRTGSARAVVEVRIRAGVLSSATQPQRDATRRRGASHDWYLVSELGADGSMAFRFTNRGLGRLAPGQPLVLPIPGLVVEASGGSRTTQIEILVTGLHLGSRQVSGTQIAPVTLSSRSGAPTLPVHFGVVGPGTVLNDGTPSRITLRITNLQPPGTGRAPRGTLEWSRATDAPTTLHLSIDASDDAFALATLDQAAAIQPSLDGWSVRALPGSVPPVWAFTARPGTPDLEPWGTARSTTDLVLSGITTTHPSGPARVVLKYFNVPGHWDGQLVGLVHKGTLVDSGGRVGIGTTEPTAELDVRGTVRAGRLELAGPAGGPGQQETILSGSWLGVDRGMQARLATVDSHRSIVLEVTFFAHDVNSNTNQRALRKVVMITRNWDRSPAVVTLQTDFDHTIGVAVDVDVVVDQNDVNLVARQRSGSPTLIYGRVAARILHAL